MFPDKRLLRHLQSMNEIHDRLYSGPIDVASTVIAEHQRITHGLVGKMAKMLQDQGGILAETNNEMLARINEIQTVYNRIAGLQLDAFSSVYETYRLSGVQSIIDYQTKLSQVFESLTLKWPEIEIVDDSIWIDGEEIGEEDLERISQLDFGKIDDSFRKTWKSLPWTLQVLVPLLVQIAVTYLPIVVQLKPDTPPLDRQQMLEVFQEAIRNMPADHFVSNLNEHICDLSEEADCQTELLQDDFTPTNQDSEEESKEICGD